MSRGKCCVNSWEYVNPAHKFYCEFLKAASVALPTTNLHNFTVEEIVNIGTKTQYFKTFDVIKKICALLKFSYTEDYVLIHYKPYYSLYSEWAANFNKPYEMMWDEWDGLLRYCRGIVLERDTGKLVLNPYKKFFNIDELGECSEERITRLVENGTIVEFSEKLDGSLIVGRWYGGDFLLTSSGQIESARSKQLATAYELLTDNIKKMMMNYPKLTFMFELISKDDPHVVKYDGADRLVLTGIKSTTSEYTLSYKETIKIGEMYGVPHTTVFDLKLGSVFEMRKTKKATEGEGFVANIDGYRVKIKYEDYFRAHSAFSALTPNKIVRAVIDGEVEELKLWCSGEEEFIDEVAEKVGRFVNIKDMLIKKYYNTIMKTKPKDKKEFIQKLETQVSDYLKPFVIMMYDEKYSPEVLLKSKAGRYVTYDDIERFMKLSGFPF